MQTLSPQLAIATRKHIVPADCSLTVQQVENLWVAYDIMRKAPGDKINLEYYRIYKDEHTEVSDYALFNECGTTGCIAGWLSSNEHFQRQGLRFVTGVPQFGGIRYKGSSVAGAAKELFGYPEMFASGANTSEHRGKIEALDRIRRTMKAFGLISTAEFFAMQDEEDQYD